MRIEAISFFLKKPHRLLFLIASVCILCGITMLHGSVGVQNYEKTTGVIRDVEETEKYMARRGYVTRYNYVLSWYDDGTYYEKIVEDQISPPVEGELIIWVRPDNRDATPTAPQDMTEQGTLFAGIGMLSGIIGTVLFMRNKKKENLTYTEKIERLVDTKLYCIIIFILSLFGAGFIGYDTYADYQKNSFIKAYQIDLLIFCGIVAVVCVILFVRANKKLKH